MNAEQQLIIYRLAHENEMSLESFLEKIQENFHIDSSDLPKDENGDTIYPNGDIGMKLDFSAEEELEIHQLAQQRGLPTNQFIIEILEERMKFIEENTDSGC